MSEQYEAYIIRYNQSYRPKTYWTGDSFTPVLNKCERYTLNQGISEYFNVLDSFSDEGKAKLKLMKCVFTMSVVDIAVTTKE